LFKQRSLKKESVSTGLVEAMQGIRTMRKFPLTRIQQQVLGVPESFIDEYHWTARRHQTCLWWACKPAVRNFPAHVWPLSVQEQAWLTKYRPKVRVIQAHYSNLSPGYLTSTFTIGQLLDMIERLHGDRHLLCPDQVEEELARRVHEASSRCELNGCYLLDRGDLNRWSKIKD
jgi:hypothetical protein